MRWMHVKVCFSFRGLMKTRRMCKRVVARGYSGLRTEGDCHDMTAMCANSPTDVMKAAPTRGATGVA